MQRGRIEVAQRAFDFLGVVGEERVQLYRRIDILGAGFDQGRDHRVQGELEVLVGAIGAVGEDIGGGRGG
ncbi:hypothetical protein D3C71_1868850 [compost metagenome]